MHHHFTPILSHFEEHLPFSLTHCILFAFLFLTLQSVCKKIASVLHQFRSFWYDDLYKDFTNPEDDAFCDGPYPNGWIPIADSQQLVSGAVMKVRTLGQDIVLVRDSNGNVHAMDPYCPHNGAHLGSGEVVKIGEQDCVRCPFHEWSFRVEDGVCVDIPYAKDKKPPRGSSLKIWQCIEENGFIHIWFHNAGEAPTWFPEQIEEISLRKMVYHDRFECLINTDAYMVAENTADYAHFVSVHDKPSPLSQKIAGILGLKKRLHEHICDHFSWESKGKPHHHQAITLYKPRWEFLGQRTSSSPMSLHQFGPYIYTFHLEAQFLCFTVKRMLVVGINPIHANKQRIAFQLYSEGNFFTKRLDRPLLVLSFNNFQRDCEIWQSLKRKDRPLYLKEERYMVSLRRWFMQFYEGADRCSIEDSMIGGKEDIDISDP